MANDTLTAIGEALIDFIPDKTGCDFCDVTGFSPQVGGAPANVCAAYSRLGGKSRMITQLGNDPFGEKITRTLRSAGVDTSHIRYTDEANTALAFVSLAADGNRTFSFYRKPSADMLLSADDISAEMFTGTFALHFCSVSLGDFPMRAAHERAIAIARAEGALISFDPNLRFPLWNDRSALKEAVLRFLPMSDIIKISDEELEFITGETDIERALPSLFSGNVRLVIYTCGADGAYAFTRSAKAFAPSVKVKAVDTTGAGDGFIGSFLWKLHSLRHTADSIDNMTARELTELLVFSNSFCAKSVTAHGAIASYPGLSEMC